jgi:hypothetical protein
MPEIYPFKFPGWDLSLIESENQTRDGALINNGKLWSLKFVSANILIEIVANTLSLNEVQTDEASATATDSQPV